MTQGIPQDGGYIAVAAGWDHALALHSDGSLRAWSTSPFQGTFGMGSIPTDNHWQPSQTPIYTAIAAGEWFNLALRVDGTIWAWGDNSHGKTSINDDSENTVGAFTAIAAGGHHGVALKSNAKIKAWGGTDYPSNVCDYSPSPAPVPGLLANTLFVGLGAGHSVTYGILADGSRTVVAWGCACAVQNNLANYVGTATNGYFIMGSGAATVTGGYEHGAELTAKTGTLQAWGDPENGCNVTNGEPPPNTVPFSFQLLNVLQLGPNNVGRHNIVIYEPPAN